MKPDDLPETELPSAAAVITSEFTLAAMRYITVLERAVEETINSGTIAHMAMFSLGPTAGRLRFMDMAGRGLALWPELELRGETYKNLLTIVTDEVKSWEKEPDAN